MKDSFNVDLKNWSIEAFVAMIKKADLIPSRKILKENIEERFITISAKGIKNLKEVLETIKTPEKIDSFVNETGIPKEYFEILKRELGSYIPKPINLIDIPEINGEYVKKLNQIGIKNTKQLFERCLTQADRDKLAQETGVPDEYVLELAKISDLSRVRWVGPLFIRIILGTETDTVEKMAGVDANEFYQQVLQVIREKNYRNVNNIVANDIAGCISFAKQLPKSIEY